MSGVKYVKNPFAVFSATPRAVVKHQQRNHKEYAQLKELRIDGWYSLRTGKLHALLYHLCIGGNQHCNIHNNKRQGRKADHNGGNDAKPLDLLLKVAVVDTKCQHIRHPKECLVTGNC